MLEYETRSAVLRLHKEGHPTRFIARTLKISRNSIKKILSTADPNTPSYKRIETLDAHLELITKLYQDCRGNQIRVHEELKAQGMDVSYSTLTSYCRRNGLSVAPIKRSGRYVFEPGQEMQHDTSPHKVIVGDKNCLLQCAGLVLCYPLMRFAQVYPQWNRFYCKVFLTQALRFFEGAAKQCMIDNSSVIIAHGSGDSAVIAPEMKAFESRFGFVFKAHRPGDANRSAKVEKSFDYIERNFYPGRNFTTLEDVNNQLLLWCQNDHQKFKRGLQTRPIDLFQTERQFLTPLPAYIPDVYRREIRTVDLEGYVSLDTNRYSVPSKLIGREVELHATIDTVRVFHKQQLITEHGRRAATRMHALMRMYQDYPIECLNSAIAQALEYGLGDVSRIETMVLERISQNFFNIPTDGSQ